MYSLFVLLIITIVSNQTEGGKSLDEEIILSVVGCVAFLPLSKHNKLQKHNKFHQSLLGGPMIKAQRKQSICY